MNELPKRSRGNGCSLDPLDTAPVLPELVEHSSAVASGANAGGGTSVPDLERS
jgi:hypothetical protein